MDNIITLSELENYDAQGLTLSEVVVLVRKNHGRAKIFDHAPERMHPHVFRYFVIPLPGLLAGDSTIKEKK